MRQNKKMIIDYKVMYVCIAIWLLLSTIIGTVCAEFIEINFLNKLFFVKPEMVKNQKYYTSVTTCLFLLSPFVFIYMCKYCVLFIGIDRKYLWTIYLAIALGLGWNSGFLSIDTQPYNHYKYDLLFMYLIQKLDWLGAVFISFIGIYMAVFFSAMLYVFFIKKENKYGK